METTVVSREQRITEAKVAAEQKAIVAREWTNRRAQDIAFGTKVTAGVVSGFVRGFFRK